MKRLSIVMAALMVGFASPPAAAGISIFGMGSGDDTPTAVGGPKPATLALSSVYGSAVRPLEYQPMACTAPSDAPELLPENKCFRYFKNKIVLDLMEGKLATGLRANGFALVPPERSVHVFDDLTGAISALNQADGKPPPTPEDVTRLKSQIEQLQQLRTMLDHSLGADASNGQGINARSQEAIGRASVARELFRQSHPSSGWNSTSSLGSDWNGSEAASTDTATMPFGQFERDKPELRKFGAVNGKPTYSALLFKAEGLLARKAGAGGAVIVKADVSIEHRKSSGLGGFMSSDDNPAPKAYARLWVSIINSEGQLIFSDAVEGESAEAIGRLDAPTGGMLGSMAGISGSYHYTLGDLDKGLNSASDNAVGLAIQHYIAEH